MRYAARQVSQKALITVYRQSPRNGYDGSSFILHNRPISLLVYLQRRLQSVLNAGARLVYRLRRYDHMVQ